MFQLDLRDSRPLYEQVKEKMKMLMMRGILKSEEKIPSVRELAHQLTINPNTIQRAYKDLEMEGYIYAVKGKGNFVTPIKEAVSEKKCEQLITALKQLVQELMYAGIKEKQLVTIIDKIYAQPQKGE